MNENFMRVLIFSAGAAVGAITTWKFVEKKYRKIAETEIEDVRNVYKKYSEDIINAHKEDNELKEPILEVDELSVNVEEAKKIQKEYNKIVKDSGYNNDEKKEVDSSKAYVISQDEYGENDDYELRELTYYADKFLADEYDELVEDVDKIIGWEKLNALEESNADAVYVRNEELKIDFEILSVLDNYKDNRGDVY